jgi:hypothetical protein
MIKKKSIIELYDQIFQWENITESLEVGILEIKFSDLMLLQNKSKQSKHCIIDVSQIKDQGLTVRKGIYSDTTGKFSFLDSSGLFKISFKDGSWLYVLKELKQYEDESFTCVGFGPEQGWINIFELNRLQAVNFNKPTTGFFRVSSRTGMGYEELKYQNIVEKNLPKVDAFHPSFDLLQMDMNVFFNSDSSRFAKFNKPFVRKVLLSGEQGTGKTTIALNCAKKFVSTHNIAIINDFGTLVRHVQNIDKFQKSGIIIFEDCEISLKKITSFGLNFLDGLNQPLIQKGVYVIFTTNYPHLIEDRIVKRPGRIDKIFTVGALSGLFARECAKYYFEDLYNLNDFEANIFDRMTGAQIENIAQSTLMESLGKNEEITFEMIKRVRNDVLSSIKEIEKSAKRDSYERSLRIGFDIKDEF